MTDTEARAELDAMLRDFEASIAHWLVLLLLALSVPAVAVMVAGVAWLLGAFEG
jgi:hypothetical protein